MSEPTDYEIAALMNQLGGSFAARLSGAWMAGDDRNRTRIKDAFPDLWQEYREMIRLRQSRQKETQ